ncbi:MAG: hypothetical protein AAF321_07705 [Pseudomonadota bacterium]
MAFDPSFDPAAVGPVLVVEDEAMIAFEAEDILNDLGLAEVTICSSYERAERAIEEEDYRLGIFDMNLNGQMSTPLIAAFKAKGGAALLATGYDLTPETLEGLGVVEVRKPYTPDTLGRAIADALEGKAVER